jgi:hypothetical protein
VTTTAVFAEILVGGVEALIWVALTIAQPSKADYQAIAKLHNWATSIAPVLLAVAYALGIVVDRVADSLFKKIFGKTSDPSNLRLQVLARGDKVTDFLEYIRSKIRVARVTTLNLALITVAMGFFLALCTSASCTQFFATIAVLLVLTGASLFTTLRIGHTYEKRLEQAVALPPPAKKP